MQAYSNPKRANDPMALPDVEVFERMASDMCWYSSGSGRIELQMTWDDARSVSHSGPCDDDVMALSRVPYISEQTAKIDPEVLASELREYGAWDDGELADHEQNVQRLLWLAGSDITEGQSGPQEPGWYWWTCFPGCLPDSEPIGPFSTEAEALADACDGDSDDDCNGFECQHCGAVDGITVGCPACDPDA